MARVTTSQTGPFSYGLNEVTIEGVGIHPGIITFCYYESLLQDSIVVTATYADSGVRGPGGKNVFEGLPVVGGEKTKVSFKDANGVTINAELFLKNNPTTGDRTTTGIYNLIMVSEEIRENNRVRVPIRFDGQPSDHVRQILTEYLKTTKNLDIEDTLIPRNFYGANKKPIYLINWLAQHSVPSATSDAYGKTAGFFYFETSEGIKFKSIDFLMGQEPKSKIIYNETPDKRGEKIPPGYDTTALSYHKSNRNDVVLKEEIGAYANRIVNFNPFDFLYEVNVYNAQEFMGAYTLAGKTMPVQETDFTRTTYYLRDIGTLPSGTTQQQIEKSKEENFKISEIRNQAIMRYNQLFISQISITIPSDYTLHVGDTVRFDAPSQQENLKNDDVDKQVGGLYIIAALCHYVTPKECLTNLTLVRDSFGRK